MFYKEKEKGYESTNKCTTPLDFYRTIPRLPFILTNIYSFIYYNYRYNRRGKIPDYG